MEWWEKGRMPEAPPAEAVAAALNGLFVALDSAVASGAVFGVAVTEVPFAEAPESGFSWIRTKY